jgi:hypothetical protein
MRPRLQNTNGRVLDAPSSLLRDLTSDKNIMTARTVRRNTRDDLSSCQWLIVFAFSIALTGLAALAVFVASSRLEADNEPSDTFANTKIGSILIERPDGACERFKFDNVGGSIGLDHRACSQMVNGSGLPGPAGTSERLSAISQSFSGK